MDGYMAYLADMPGQLMEKMWFSVDNIHVFVAWIIGYIVGYMLYTHASRVGKEQGVAPYPLWIHCYMITIDIIGTITFVYLAITNDFYWFFCVQSIALPIWIYMEFQSIKSGIKNAEERQFEFGKLVKGPVTERDALKYCLGIFFASAGVNLLALSMIGGFNNAAVWMIYPFTNYVYAIWTWRFWDARYAENGMCKYNSVGLQWVITICCITSWCPILSWWWEVSPFFHNPYFIIGGIVCTLVSCYNLYRAYQMPKYDPAKDPARIEQPAAA